MENRGTGVEVESNLDKRQEIIRDITKGATVLEDVLEKRAAHSYYYYYVYICAFKYKHRTHSHLYNNNIMYICMERCAKLVYKLYNVTLKLCEFDVIRSIGFCFANHISGHVRYDVFLLHRVQQYTCVKFSWYLIHIYKNIISIYNAFKRYNVLYNYYYCCKTNYT